MLASTQHLRASSARESLWLSSLAESFIRGQCLPYLLPKHPFRARCARVDAYGGTQSPVFSLHTVPHNERYIGRTLLMISSFVCAFLEPLNVIYLSVFAPTPALQTLTWASSFRCSSPLSPSSSTSRGAPLAVCAFRQAPLACPSSAAYTTSLSGASSLHSLPGRKHTVRPPSHLTPLADRHIHRGHCLSPALP